jgi:hypothetical protein
MNVHGPEHLEQQHEKHTEGFRYASSCEPGSRQYPLSHVSPALSYVVWVSTLDNTIAHHLAEFLSAGVYNEWEC